MKTKEEIKQAIEDCKSVRLFGVIRKCPLYPNNTIFTDECRRCNFENSMNWILKEKENNDE